MASRGIKSVLFLVFAMIIGITFQFTLCQDANATLLASWSFDDGTATDQTGNGRDGTLVNGPVSDSSGLPNGSGKSMKFDGINDYIALNMSFAGANALSALTVSAWFKTGVTGGSNFSNWAILDFDRSEFFNIYVRGDDGKIGFSTSIGGPSQIHDQTGSAFVANDEWHHVAAVYDGTDKRIYVDGVLDENSVASNPHAGNDLGSNITRYGFMGDGSEASTLNGSRNGLYYDGLLDDIGLWNVALTKAQIESLADGVSPLSVSPVPEPATMLLLGVGLTGLAALNRRRRKRT